jgi:hypothetical protein
MPHDYSNVREAGGITLDDEETELREVEAVRDAAVRSLGYAAILLERGQRQRGSPLQSMRADEAGYHHF